MRADNNYCENQIRPFAVGRRSWLFVDSQLGAKASANLYSIVMTCRANGIEPYASDLPSPEHTPTWLTACLRLSTKLGSLKQIFTSAPFSITKHDLPTERSNRWSPH